MAAFIPTPFPPSASASAFTPSASSALSARPPHRLRVAQAPRRPSPSTAPHIARAPPRMLVLTAGSTDDMDKILKSADSSLVVVDYSTSWCGPCKMFASVFEELSEKHTDVVFVKVMGDADTDAAELMKREGIRAVPAFHYWKENARVHDITGAKKEDVEDAIKKFK